MVMMMIIRCDKTEMIIISSVASKGVCRKWGIIRNGVGKAPRAEAGMGFSGRESGERCVISCVQWGPGPPSSCAVF